MLRAGVPAAAGGESRGGSGDRGTGGSLDGKGSRGATANAGLPGGVSGAAAPPAADGSLLGMEAALEGLGLDPETLRLVGSAAAAAAAAGGGEEGGAGAGAGLMSALAGLKEAEERARAAAEVLEGLGEGSPVAGQVRWLYVGLWFCGPSGSFAGSLLRLRAVFLICARAVASSSTWTRFSWRCCAAPVVGDASLATLPKPPPSQYILYFVLRSPVCASSPL